MAPSKSEFRRAGSKTRLEDCLSERRRSYSSASFERSAILGEVVLGGELGVPCTGNPRHAGLITRLRPLIDRVKPPASSVDGRVLRDSEP